MHGKPFPVVRYFGVGLSGEDAHAVLAYLERQAKPEHEPSNPSIRRLPLTFLFDDAQVQFSDLPYTMAPNNSHANIDDFYRAVTLEIQGDKPEAIFVAFSEHCKEVARSFAFTDKIYPYANASEVHARSRALVHVSVQTSPVPDYMPASLESELVHF